MKNLLILILAFSLQFSSAQNNSIFSRLSVIENNGTTFYNIDGVDFSSKVIPVAFNKQNLDDIYRKFNITEKDTIRTNELLSVENYKKVDRTPINDSMQRLSVNYLIRNKDDQIRTVWFNEFNKSKPVFEAKMIELILNKQIPDSCFSDLVMNKVNFAGRELDLKDKCQWMGVNNVQCPYNGQMNWSVHKDKESADLISAIQYALLTGKEGGNVASVEEVNIIFEDVPTTAKKVKFVLTGLTSDLASMSGGTELTIYYISEKVRGNYISCTLSHWNNDNFRPSGLPPLLDEVMSLEKTTSKEVQKTEINP